MNSSAVDVLYRWLAGGRYARSGKGSAGQARQVAPMRVLGCLLALLPVLAFGEEFQTPAITAERLTALRGTPEEPVVVDVRPLAEYKTGHVAGAVNVPHNKLEQRLDELKQAQNGVVLYCTLGHRTRLAEQTLLDHGVPDVRHLEGGLGAWRQGGHPIHTGWGP